MDLKDLMEEIFKKTEELQADLPDSEKQGHNKCWHCGRKYFFSDFHEQGYCSAKCEEAAQGEEQDEYAYDDPIFDHETTEAYAIARQHNSLS